MPEKTWKKEIAKIEMPDEEIRQGSLDYWNHLAKPLHGMGELEKMIARIAGIQKTIHPTISKKGIVVLCADNGIVEEGVSQTGAEVTAVVAGNFLTGQTSVCKMAKVAGADILPYDIGIRTEVDGLTKEVYKVSCGTRNFLREPAMTREETIRAIMTGMQIVKERKEEGYEILATGEMGIGNTTTSSAVACALTGEPVEVMAGRGAGLSDAGLLRKKAVIEEGLEKWKPDMQDPVDILSKVGGLDIAGLTGVFLGCARYQIPAVMDGFISSVAALAAVRIEPKVREYLFASHRSKEPAHNRILEELRMEAGLDLGMALGEGTGACALFPLLDMAMTVYEEMSSFEDIQVEQYEEFTS